MSSTYKNLSEEDLKLENESLNALENQLQPKAPGLGKNFKVIIITGFILSLASVIGSGYLYKAINKEKRNREALEASQVQIREKAGVMELDTAKSKSEILKLRQQLQTYSTQRADFEKKLDQSRREVAQLRSKLKDLEDKSDAIQKAASKVQTELGLTGAPAIPGAAAAVSVPAVKTFQVLTVNRKFNFVVINLGLKDNAKVGDALQIQRDGKTVGQASIEKIYDNFAAATIVKEDKDAPLKEGDKVSKA